jgi:hypothetical protein
VENTGHEVLWLTGFVFVKSNKMRLAGHAAHLEEMRTTHNILIGKPEGQRPVRSRWEDNIKT